MHYIAWVVANDEDHLAEVMDPYNENEHATADCSCKARGDEGCNGDGTFCQVNPRGKWDWYVIGGRWSGAFGSGIDQYQNDLSAVMTPAQALEWMDSRQAEEWSSPFSFVAAEMWADKRIYHPERDYPDCFEDVPEWEAKVRGWLNQLRPDQRIYAVDYHT